MLYITYTWNLNKTDECIQQNKNRIADIENKLMVTKGERRRGRDKCDLSWGGGDHSTSCGSSAPQKGAPLAPGGTEPALVQKQAAQLSSCHGDASSCCLCSGSYSPCRSQGCTGSTGVAAHSSWQTPTHAQSLCQPGPLNSQLTPP